MANNEWYTPKSIVDVARQVLGYINLDPASCEAANKIVRAECYYTKETNGLSRQWFGKVWLNPPYSRDLIGPFIEKLARSRSQIDCAIVLVNAATATQWCQRLIGMSNAVCFPAKRIRFIDGARIMSVDGAESARANPNYPQMIASIGCNPGLFALEFGRIGRVLEVVP